ncbi:hypothetical protein [Micromonospora sp. ATA51]|uniref:hypothetical protein n=1 Tax=Micromonospora sp. ATA51 TaxID=2806098 RepID=UPI001A4D7C25|nr:hypothetical protein [Micromonospora sp. ATA51]MBM0227978.1 hypothetical protein [Micromonospora sp. ATA51]
MLESGVHGLLVEFKVEEEGRDRHGLIAQMALRVVLAEQQLERLADELQAAVEKGVGDARRGDLRTSVAGGLLAAVSGKAAAYDAALMRVAERREILAMAAERVRAAREAAEAKPAPELADGDEVSWTWDGEKRTGKVGGVASGLARIAERDGEVWVLPIGELTKVPPANAMEHADCQGFDNQEFYWHCYTHEVFNQQF